MSELSTDITARHTTTAAARTGETIDVLAPAAVDALATSVALDGLDNHGGDVLTFAYAARGREVSSVLLGVLTDADAPEVVRLRAFGLVVRALARPARRATPAAQDAATPPPAPRVPVLV